MLRFATLLIVGSTIAFPLVAQRPIDKGVWLVGGNLQLTGNKDLDSEVSDFQFSLSPQVGLFVAPGLAITGNATLAWTDGDNSNTFTRGFGPGLSHFFSGMGARFYPYLTGRVLYQQSDLEVQLGPIESESEITDWSWLLGVGGAFFLARNVALNGELFYSRRSGDLSTGAAETEFSTARYGLEVGIRAFVF
jgi:hypothetical protein